MSLFVLYSFWSDDYAGSSSSNNQDKNVTLLDSINNLYKEMIMTNIKPIEKCTQNMIDATAIFCDCAKLGYSLQLAKAGATIEKA